MKKEKENYIERMKIWLAQLINEQKQRLTDIEFNDKRIHQIQVDTNLQEKALTLLSTEIEYAKKEINEPLNKEK